MEFVITFLVTFFAGMGAGLGTGFAGMSAAAVISPMLITFLGMDPYMAVSYTHLGLVVHHAQIQLAVLEPAVHAVDLADHAQLLPRLADGHGLSLIHI